MTKEEYDRIAASLEKLVTDAACIGHAMEAARVGCMNIAPTPAGQAITISGMADSLLGRWKRIEPNWNRPDTSDCHTHS